MHTGVLQPPCGCGGSGILRWVGLAGRRHDWRWSAGRL